jgi:pyridoxal 5'-phosphate synthase pdxS subunit
METEKSTWTTKVGLAQQLRGGVIMDVTNAEQALIAAEAGAVAVMALERVPSDIRAQGGVARMTDPQIIREIIAALREHRYEIPVMAKARIGHFVEAQILEAIGVDFVDESEVLTPADEEFHINKHLFRVPFVCGCRDLGEALRRIGEGAAMIRTKGEAGTGNVVEAVRHMRAVQRGIRTLAAMREEELMTEAKKLQAPYELVVETARSGKLPVPNFSAGGCATPADAALMMQLGAEAVFVGSGIFKAAAQVTNPAERRELTLRRAKAIVAAVVYYDDPRRLAEVSTNLGEAMSGLDVRTMDPRDLLATRGW